MGRRSKDLTGTRFGRLIALDKARVEKYNNNQRPYWNCLCDCGNTKQIAAHHLTSGNTLSCGCLKLEKSKQNLGGDNLRGNRYARKGYGENAFNVLYTHYKTNAKNKDRSFELTKDIFRVLTSNNCFYCGNPPTMIKRPKNSYGEYIYNGIDRFLNNVGYTVENSVPCCWECNKHKGSMDGPEYLELCRRVASHWSNREMERAA